MSENEVNVSFDRSKVLGSGVYGSVYEGSFEGKTVAVKRTHLIYVNDLITKDEFLKNIRHSNLVMLLHIAKDKDFRLTVMELCATSLDRIILRNNDPNKYNGPMPSNDQVLLQLANGLGYLHSIKILHGDIKPENILISSTEPVQMKWTGFGFRQPNLNDTYSRSMSQQSTSKYYSTRMGPRIWWAPETYKNEAHVSEIAETFSAGCLFLYFLSDGRHPFANPHDGEYKVSKNITNGTIVNEIDVPEELNFVKQMIERNPKTRIPLYDVIIRLESLRFSKPIVSLSSLQYDVKSYLNGRYSIGLYFTKSEGVVVKRIPNKYCSTEVYKEFEKCNLSNIVRLHLIEKDQINTFLVIEYCVASLDQCFPTEGHGKLYPGPMPSHEQFFFQLVTGLQYIHEKGLVHGSIKPSNILIRSSQDPQIKLSEFGFTLPRWNNDNSAISDSGFMSDKYWLAPELHHAFTAVDRKEFTSVFIPKKESDVYASGKVFFYYYVQSYSNINSNHFLPNELIENEIFKKLPAMGYWKNRSEHFPIQMISKMSEKASENRLTLASVLDRILSYQLTSKRDLENTEDPGKLSIKFSRDHILGKGGQAVVYLGVYEGSIVAVKRICTRIHNPEVTKELKLKNLDHCNIVKFICSAIDKDFMHIAIEKCLVSLDSFCKKPQLYHGVIPMPSDKEVLLQMATGLQYIHSQNLIHRDVKPGNILISGDKPAVLKWSDFGLSKYITNKNDEENSKEDYWSFPQGTEGWMAPEMISKGEKLNDKDNSNVGQECDIFPLGCVFFFFLFSASHPFGNKSHERKINVMEGNPINFKKYCKRNLQFSQIIKGMIEFYSRQRTKISEVIEQLQQCDEDYEISELADELTLQLSFRNISPLDLEPDIKKHTMYWRTSLDPSYPIR